MQKQLAIFLILFSELSSWPAFAAVQSEELSGYLQNQDWPAVVLLLKAKEGQNFEQDLILAKALLSLERRIDALKVLLNTKQSNKSSEKTIEKMVELFSSQFFNQETSRLYYEAIGLMSNSKWVEAKEKLELANTKEPGNGLVLQRLIQMEMILEQKELVQEHLKLALELNPYSKEVKIFEAKHFLLQKDSAAAFRLFQNLKPLLQENEVACSWYLEALFSLNKQAEMTGVLQKTVKSHPQWLWVQLWFLKKQVLSLADQKLFIAQITKSLKEIDKYKSYLENEARRSEYHWVGFFNADSVRTEFELFQVPPTKP